MRTLAAALVGMLSVAPLLANAALISVDLESPGDGLITRDTLNNREWLDLPATSGASLAGVMADMMPGGRYAGFTFASLDEVTGLAASANVGWWTWDLGAEGDPHVAELVDRLGWVVHLSGGVLENMYFVSGLVAQSSTASDPVFDDTNFYVAIIPARPMPPGWPAYDPLGGVFIDKPLWPETAIGIGDIGPFWMFRNIPEPSTGPLVVQMLIGLIGMRRAVAATISPAMY